MLLLFDLLCSRQLINEEVPLASAHRTLFIQFARPPPGAPKRGNRFQPQRDPLQARMNGATSAAMGRVAVAAALPFA